MTRLIARLRELASENPPGDAHCHICNVLANEFDLWNMDNRFPIWLSRIVEGELRDMANGELSDDDSIGIA